MTHAESIRGLKAEASPRGTPAAGRVGRGFTGDVEFPVEVERRALGWVFGWLRLRRGWSAKEEAKVAKVGEQTVRDAEKGDLEGFGLDHGDAPVPGAGAVGRLAHERDFSSSHPPRLHRCAKHCGQAPVSKSGNQGRGREAWSWWQGAWGGLGKYLSLGALGGAGRGGNFFPEDGFFFAEDDFSAAEDGIFFVEDGFSGKKFRCFFAEDDFSAAEDGIFFVEDGFSGKKIRCFFAEDDFSAAEDGNFFVEDGFSVAEDGIFLAEDVSSGRKSGAWESLAGG